MKKILIVFGVIVVIAASVLACSSDNTEGTSKSLSGKHISVLGDSISTLDGISNNADMNETIRNNNAFYNDTKITKEQSYWGLLIDKYDMELCVNNSTGGGKVSDDVGSDGVRLSGVKRSVELHNTDGQTPDIIAVYMGTNDFLTFVPVTIFEETYTQMLDSMLEKYEEAEIFCFTLLPAKDSMYENQMSIYNDKIRACVEQYEDRVTLVDIYEKSGITWDNFSEYTSDGLHPNAEGMKLIADVFEESLLTIYTKQN